MPQKSAKPDRQISSTASSVENKPKGLTEAKLHRKVRKQGRRKIQPFIRTNEENSIQKGEQAAAIRTATTETFTEPHQNVIKVNATDPKLMEVVKQINESLQMKYNHKQTSTHSIDMMMMMSTAEANNDGDDDDYEDSGRSDASNMSGGTKAYEFLSTEPQMAYDDDYVEEEIHYINATRRSWPTDFMEEPLTTATTTTTDVSYQSANHSNELKFNDSREADASEIPLALSALNIPPSLWPKLPGNITKLGTPYEAESSAEEPALCVPITVREHNIMDANELIYIERIFCFPMPPPLSTASVRSVRVLNNVSSSSISTTTLKTVTTTKVQNFEDFAARPSRANSFRKNVFLIASLLVIYLKFIV